TPSSLSQSVWVPFPDVGSCSFWLGDVDLILSETSSPEILDLVLTVGVVLLEEQLLHEK
ncbi:hypothetical protein Tco_1325251, partial [Tanacetum coccineum]